MHISYTVVVLKELLCEYMVNCLFPNDFVVPSVCMDALSINNNYMLNKDLCYIKFGHYVQTECDKKIKFYYI